MSWRVWVLLMAALALAVGAILPWVSWVGLWGEEARGAESLAMGWEGDGVITSLCGLVIAALALWKRGAMDAKRAAGVMAMALVSALVVVADVMRIFEIGPAAGVMATIRAGLVLTGVGALAALVAGALSLRPWRQA